MCSNGFKRYQRQPLAEAVFTLVVIYDLTHKAICVVTALKGTKEAQCHALFFFII
jgi:hypothetical protein